MTSTMSWHIKALDNLDCAVSKLDKWTNEKVATVQDKHVWCCIFLSVNPRSYQYRSIVY